MIRRPPRSTLDRSSAASDVYKRQQVGSAGNNGLQVQSAGGNGVQVDAAANSGLSVNLSLIHISEPTRPY